MNLKDIYLKKAYSSDYDDILEDFYIPVLQKSKEYYRISGFFSSTSLAIAAKGITGLIKNNGLIKMIVSPKLTKKDVDVILKCNESMDEYLSISMLREVYMEESFIKDHIGVLGWLLTSGKLEIKVALIYDKNGNLMPYDEVEKQGIFHQKIGILKDNEKNIVSFSGSINETAMGWLENIEEFKVFRSWEDSENDYIVADLNKFKRYWENTSDRVKVRELPSAIKDELIKYAPNDIDDLNLNKWYLKKKKKKLFYYQNEAVTNWLENGYKGIFEMATGTGKTFTSIGCLDKIFVMSQKEICIITCPKNHLVQQWKREIGKFGLEFQDISILEGTNTKWRKDLIKLLIDTSLGYKNKSIIITTHQTLSSNDFIEIVKMYKRQTKILLIADEVHGLGAKKSKNGLLSEYDMRLGLSATPRRWFDDIGTENLFSYFGDIVYEFSLRKAVNTVNPATNETYLTPYRYNPIFFSLQIEELETYIKQTSKIVKRLGKSKDRQKNDEILELLLFQRANIVKDAREKYKWLDYILSNMSLPIKHMIIYCSPAQIDGVMDLLQEKGIVAHRFTQNEGTNLESRYGGESERDYLIKKFAEGKYQVLVAMECLDEGVDIPQAKIAILMASSTNPRQYIQRIGRVIRRYPGKNEAMVYDMIMIPSIKAMPEEWKKIEWNIFKKELQRVEEISSIAVNNAEIMEEIFKVRSNMGDGNNG